MCGMTEESKIILRVSDLDVSFGPERVIENLDFEIKQGEVLAIVGPNGAGKSVLFRTLLGLIPHGGKIQWSSGIQIGYVPQRLFVEPGLPLSVEEFLGFNTDSKEKIKSALASVGLKDDNIIRQKLGLLSGGQLQRVLIAWAIVKDPNVLLFDEPTAGIDIGGEETVYNLLHQLQERNDLTVLLISHDLNIVYKYADTVLCLNKSKICFGEPSVALDPASLSALYGGEAKFYQHQHDKA